MGKNKNKAKIRNNKKYKTPQDGLSSGEPCSLRSSVSGVTTAANIRTYDGTAEDPTPSSMSSYAMNIEANPSSKSKEQGESLLPPRPRRRWWKRWMPRPCGWWPCRTYRWIRDFLAAFFHLFFTQYWMDQLHTLGLVAIFVFGCWVAIEGLLHMFPPVTAQDANCSVVYVTVPGPIVTVSLIGATPSDPNHGTYYYSVISGTTQWLNSIAPPTRFSTLVTTTQGAITTPSLPLSSGQPITGSLPPGLPPKISSSTAAPPAPGNPLNPTIITSSTALFTPSASAPLGGSPPVSLPLATSATIPISGGTSSGVLGLPSTSGQPLLSQPPPVVVTRTVMGPSSKFTTTTTLWNGT